MFKKTIFAMLALTVIATAAAGTIDTAEAKAGKPGSQTSSDYTDNSGWGWGGIKF